jgi:hypothetical protein
MSQISNPHYLYAHSSVATQSQLVQYIHRCLDRLDQFFGMKLDREFQVNTVTKYDGTPLLHSYIWVKDIKVANLLINKTIDGKERTEELEDPEHDTTEDEKRLQDFYQTATPMNASWVSLVEEEENLIVKTKKRTIFRPLPHYVSFGTIEPTSEQKIKYPDIKEIVISFFDCSIRLKSGFSYTKLYANHCPKDITEKQIRKYFEKYVPDQKDPHGKKSYPLIQIDRKSTNGSILLTFQPCSFDVFFIILMAKRAIIDEHVLNFELYKERN